MERSIHELCDAVQSSLIGTNKKIASFSAQQKEIERMLGDVLDSDTEESLKRVEYRYWSRRMEEIGLSAAYLLFAANQLNAALNSFESAERHLEAYKNQKK